MSTRYFFLSLRFVLIVWFCFTEISGTYGQENNQFCYYSENQQFLLTPIEDRLYIRDGTFNRNIELRKKIETFFPKKEISYQYSKFVFNLQEVLLKKEEESFSWEEITSKNSKEESFFLTLAFKDEKGFTRIPINSLFLKEKESCLHLDYKKLLKSWDNSVLKIEQMLGGAIRIIVGNDTDIFRLTHQLFKTGYFTFVTPEFISTAIPSNSSYNDQWYLKSTNQAYTTSSCVSNNPPILTVAQLNKDINVEPVWALGIDGNKNGDKIKVAIFDTGVDFNHPDLDDNVVSGFDALNAADPTFTNLGGLPQLDNNITFSCNSSDSLYNPHGTGCAGIIAMEDNNIGGKGIAYDASIFAVRVLSKTPSCETFECFNNLGNIDITDYFSSPTVYNHAVQYALNQNIDIISHSVALPEDPMYNLIIDTYLLQARNGLGGVFVSGSGNYNESEVEFPSSMSEVISVGASSLEGKRKSSFTQNEATLFGCNMCFSVYDNHGVSLDNRGWWGSSFGQNLSVVAPGTFIFTTHPNNEYYDGGMNGYFEGTSSSCPIVAGVLALILDANPNLSNKQARFALEAFTTKQNAYSFLPPFANTNPNGSWNQEVGYGLINAFNSVQDVYNATCSGGQQFTDSFGSFSDGSISQTVIAGNINSDYNYQKNLDCEWLIDIPNGSSIDLTIEYDLAPGDFLNIYEGTDSNGNLIQTLSNNSATALFPINSGSIFIHFVTDNNDNGGTGWNINYSSEQIECGNNVCESNENCSSCPEDCGLCSHCNDGELSGDETGPDCGGSCEPCPPCGNISVTSIEIIDLNNGNFNLAVTIEGESGQTYDIYTNPQVNTFDSVQPSEGSFIFSGFYEGQIVGVNVENESNPSNCNAYDEVTIVGQNTCPPNELSVQGMPDLIFPLKSGQGNNVPFLGNSSYGTGDNYGNIDGFGYNWIFDYCQGQPRLHAGLDYFSSGLASNILQDEVVASFGGVLKSVYNAGGNWGYGVVLEHNHNGLIFTTTYIHLTQNSLAYSANDVNTFVPQGTTLGKIKSLTVNTLHDNSHLHYGVRRATYGETSKRGALPQAELSNCECDNDPLFPEKFINPAMISYIDWSNQPSSYSENPSINLEPSGIDIFANTTLSIQWDNTIWSNNSIANLYYSTNNGVDYTYLVSTDYSNGEYLWNLPTDITSGSLFLKIENTINQQYDEIDVPLQVIPNNNNYTITGEIYFEGTPLTNLNVSFNGYSATWDNNSSIFTIDDLPGGLSGDISVPNYIVHGAEITYLNQNHHFILDAVSYSSPPEESIYNLYYPFYQSRYNESSSGTNGWEVECNSICETHIGGDIFAQDWNWGTYENADCGKVIFAPLTGTVLFAGNTPVPSHYVSCSCHSYGKQVIIQSEYFPDKAFRMSHMNSVNVVAGDKIIAGDFIGTLGNSGSGCCGNSSGQTFSFTCHAHMAMHQNLNSTDIANLQQGRMLFNQSKAQRFEFNYPDEISVQSPFSGDCYTQGDVIDIQLEERGTVQAVFLELKNTATNATVEVIAQNTVLDRDETNNINVLNYAWTIPNTVPDGNYRIKVYDSEVYVGVDEVAIGYSGVFSIDNTCQPYQLADLTPLNSTATSAFNVNGLNLAAFNNTVLVIGEPFDVNYEIHNIGEEDAAVNVTGIILSDDTNISLDDVVLYANSDNFVVAANNFATMQQQLVLNEGTSPGDYTMFFVVDYDENVNESDESNNIISIPVSVITDPNVCPPMSSLEIQNVSADAVDINWGGSASYLGYVIEHRVLGSGSTWTQNGATAPPFSLSSLNACTTYEIKVYGVCEVGVLEEFSTISFQTTGCSTGCDTVTGLYVDSVTNDDAQFHWNPVAGASSYEVAVVGTGLNYTNTTTDSDFYFNNGLDPCVSYTVSISSICGGQTQTAASSTFLTAGCPNNEPDLSIDVLTIPDAQYDLGDDIPIHFNTRNIGTGDTYFYSFSEVNIDDDLDPDNGRVLHLWDETIDIGFEAGDNDIINSNRTITGIADGCYYLIFSSDHYDHLEEINEGNNDVVYSIEIGAGCNGGGPSGNPQVTYPNGGETLLQSTEYDVTWETMGCSSVTIEFSVDNGQTWEYITQSGQDDGSHSWSAGAYDVTERGLIRVTCNDNPLITDVSNNVFTLTNSANVPSNDEPCGATTLPVQSSCNFTMGTTIGAFDSFNAPEPQCSGYPSSDVWYKVTVPSNGVVNINTQEVSYHKAFIEVYTGTCGNLTYLDCDEHNGSGNMPYLNLSGLTPNTTLYIRFWFRIHNYAGGFGICANNCALDITGGTVTNASCGNNNGSISGVAVTGASNPSYTWKNANNTTVGTNLNLNNVPTGTYTLTVNGGGGCTLSKSYFIDAGTLAPVADFDALSVAYTGYFDANTVSGYSYNWTFGDGQSATGASPEHTYTNENTYNVCLTVSNSCGSDTHCENITIELNLCPTPYGFSTTNITSTSSTVHWQTSGSIQPSSYQTRISPLGENNWSTYTTSNTSRNFTGLSAGTVYEVQVRADCGGSVGEWSQSWFIGEAGEVFAKTFYYSPVADYEFTNCLKVGDNYFMVGRLWTTLDEYKRTLLLVLDSSGNILKETYWLDSRSYAVTTDGSNFYIGNKDTGKIHKFNSNGNYLETIDFNLGIYGLSVIGNKLYIIFAGSNLNPSLGSSYYHHVLAKYDLSTFNQEFATLFTVQGILGNIGLPYTSSRVIELSDGKIVALVDESGGKSAIACFSSTGTPLWSRHIGSDINLYQLISSNGAFYALGESTICKISNSGSFAWAKTYSTEAYSGNINSSGNLTIFCSNRRLEISSLTGDILTSHTLSGTLSNYSWTSPNIKKVEQFPNGQTMVAGNFGAVSNLFIIVQNNINDFLCEVVNNETATTPYTYAPIITQYTLTSPITYSIISNNLNENLTSSIEGNISCGNCDLQTSIFSTHTNACRNETISFSATAAETSTYEWFVNNTSVGTGATLGIIANSDEKVK